jgi:1-deoxy-D-xylulose-5-phosphate reductoisomerase
MIETVIHPQSIIHSMVEFEDGSIMAQLGETDMRIPISYAMAFPERVDSGVAPLDFAKLAKLTFFAPDFGRFPLLKAAYDVLEEADTSACVIMNAADEVAVDMFLRGKIRFLDIARRVLSALENLPRLELRSLSDIRQFHHETTERLAGLDS